MLGVSFGGLYAYPAEFEIGHHSTTFHIHANSHIHVNGECHAAANNGSHSNANAACTCGELLR